MSISIDHPPDLIVSVVIPVFRDARNALALVAALRHQKLPDGYALEMIVVDDGSGDGTATTIRDATGTGVTLLCLPENRGRAAARNAGAEAARGTWMAFIDCDCRPSSVDFLASHVDVLQSGAVASCGAILGDGNRFWTRYQRDASARRVRQHETGTGFSGSSGNLAVKRHAFLKCGAFDVRYRCYGFEDRDLLVRLAAEGEVKWCHHAVVEHLDALTLPGVLEKMQLAGGESATLFSNDHPGAYVALGYAAIDTRLHPWLRPLCKLFAPTLKSAPAMDRLIAQTWMPYPLAKLVVKLFTALAFAIGTMASSETVNAGPVG